MFGAVAVLLSVLLIDGGIAAHSLQDLQNLRFLYDSGKRGLGLAPSKAAYRIGDMVFDYDPFHRPFRKRNSRAATSRRERIWPHGVIPYEINGNFSGEHKSLFQKAMRHWENVTCLSFVPRQPSHENYIVFTVDKCGCCSYVGRRGDGPQAVSIGKNCDKFGIVVHELGHAVGFWHEHTRPDRDKYVDIFYKSIQTAQDYNFDKSKPEEVDSLGETYDYASIMHYARDTFSKAPYLDTILPKQPTLGERPEIGQRIKLSEGDIRQTNKLYRCPTCGQTLLEEYGELSATPRSTNCQWRVVAAQGEMVVLNISTNFLPLPSSSCAGERDNFIIIRDGHFSGSPIIDKICGGVRSRTYASTGNRLFIQLRKHPSVLPPPGFANYGVVCGGSLTADEGIIESPRFPEYYSSDANCVWAITVPVGFRVAVKFQYFHVEQHKDCIYDRLEFYEGHVERKDRRLGRFCGTNVPESIQTESENQMLVKFASDSSVQKPGFQFEFVKEFDECASGTHQCEHRCVNQIGRYTCECMIGYSLRADGKTCEPTCGGVIKASNGSFQTPNFPVRYEPNTECTWELEADEGHQIIVNFTHFNVEGLKTECAYDYVKIGKITGSQHAFEKLCGDYHEPFVVTSLTNKLRVSFVSDSSVEKTGFGAYFLTDFDECQYGQHQCDHICVNTIGSYKCLCENGYVLAPDGRNCKEGGCAFQLNDPSGVITSPNFPDEYSNFKRCQWHFVTTPGHRLALTFDEFVLEEDRSCSYDRVEVFDGGDSRSAVLGAFCGLRRPPKLVSTSNELFVVMQSDSTVTRRGFRAYYESECGSVLSATRSVGYIYSHARYSDNKYDKKLNCRWEISSSDRNQGVELRFTQFAVEMGTSCEYDYVAIYDGSVATENNKFGQFCGDKIPPVFVSTSQVVVVEFVTDDSVEQKGFVLEYRATAPSGQRNRFSPSVYSPREFIVNNIQ
ncbi:hypothetical protein QR680_014670 [Steinernema hermaphroditum]|uniref:Metalloendopeptidase n=1 Tax=Steinernema hermaphroditum TaxID=289476 RepID=A0AA39I9Q2_9BILA|nr:hypothetical protein QR680_014670 [Steinernema hermaphroditum]